MRRYLQLVIVLALFALAVLIRSLREPGGEQAAAGPVEAEPHTVFLASPAPPYATTAPPAPEAPAVAAPVTPTSEVGPDPGPVPPEAPVTPTPSPQAVPSPTVTPAAPEDAPAPPLATGHEAPAPTVPSLFQGAVFRDGAFTGKAIRTSYGYVQVSVTMRNGWIEDVIIVEYPAATGTSERMSAEVLPRLVNQALARQDWDVDAVSGATQTSNAFRVALVWALRQADKTWQEPT